MGAVDLNELNRTLGEMIGRAQAMEPAMREGSQVLVSEFQQNFREGGRPERWKPSGRALKQGGQTLRDTGALEHSLLVPQVDGKSVTFGSNLPYAAIHLFGGQIRQGARSELFTRNRKRKGPGRGQFARGTRPGQGNTLGERIINIPQRDYSYVSPEAIETFGDILRGYVVEGN